MYKEEYRQLFEEYYIRRAEEQKILQMTLEEFKAYISPEKWKVMYVVAQE